MTKKFVVPIFSFSDTNRQFGVFLSNPRLDANESPEVSAPRLDPALGAALIRILNVWDDPVMDRNLDTNGDFVGPSNSVFNFTKAHFVVPEDVNDYYPTNTPAAITVMRSGQTGNQ